MTLSCLHSCVAGLTALVALSACKEPEAPPDVGPGQLAFASDRASQFDIYLMNANGTGIHRLTDHLAFDFWPSWSPDGTRLAFHSNRDGIFQIYVMNADGSGAARLTNLSAPSELPAW